MIKAFRKIGIEATSINLIKDTYNLHHNYYLKIKCFPAKIRNKKRMSALKSFFQHHNGGSSKHNKTKGEKRHLD